MSCEVVKLVEVIFQGKVVDITLKMKSIILDTFHF